MKRLGTMAVLVCMLVGSLSAAEEPRLALEALFDRQGLAALSAGDQNVLTEAAPVVRAVRLAEKYWNPNEGAGDPYAGTALGITDGSVEVQARTFDKNRSTLTLKYPWGIVSVHYAPEPDRLDLTVTVTNTSGKVLNEIRMDLLTLRLPGTVKTRVVSSEAHWARSGCNVGAPLVVSAEHKGGKAVLCALGPGRPLTFRFAAPRKPKDDVTPVKVTLHGGGGGEVYDGVWNVRPVKPGKTDQYALSLRFASEAVSAVRVARDVYERYGEQFPMTYRWPDRRPIGAVHVADGRTSKDNPRGWHHAGEPPRGWSISDANAIEAFGQKLLKNADSIIRVARQVGCQGVIIWQIEGQEHKRAAYYGEPRIVPYVAPEMDAIADEYFAKLRDAGLRVGITIRPNIFFPLDVEGKPCAWHELAKLKPRPWLAEIPEQYRNVYGPEEAQSPLARLDAKIAYAKKRWKCSLFYVDTNHFWRPRDRSQEKLGWKSKMLSAEVFRELAERHPDVLIVPEHEYVRYWAYSAPYRQPPRWGGSTPAGVRAAWPRAMSVISMNDVKHFSENIQHYAEAVKAGDSLLMNGWFGGRHVKVAQEIYMNATADSTLRLSLTADSDLAEMRKLVKEKTAEKEWAARRVIINYTPEARPRLKETVAAVIDAGGVVAWTREMEKPGE